MFLQYPHLYTNNYPEIRIILCALSQKFKYSTIDCKQKKLKIFVNCKFFYLFIYASHRLHLGDHEFPFAMSLILLQLAILPLFSTFSPSIHACASYNYSILTHDIISGHPTVSKPLRNKCQIIITL